MSEKFCPNKKIGRKIRTGTFWEIFVSAKESHGSEKT